MTKRTYYKNGKPKWETICHEGKRHGVEKYWYINGQLHYEHPYHEGQLHGISKGWWGTGQPRYKEYFLYGSLVSKEEYRRHELIKKLSGL